MTLINDIIGILATIGFFTVIHWINIIIVERRWTRHFDRMRMAHLHGCPMLQGCEPSECKRCWEEGISADTVHANFVAKTAALSKEIKREKQ